MACLLAVVAAAFAPALVTRGEGPAAANPVPGNYYIAVGDSFSAGYLTSDRPIDSQCTSPTAPGFVCVFWRYLKEVKPGINFHNFSESGADSCELAGAGHLCNSTAPQHNPLDDAVAFLNAHANQVSPITVTIGGNDLLLLLIAGLNDLPGTVAQLPAVLTRYRANLDVILSRLRAAAPNAEIIVTTQPNPFGGLGSPPLPSILANQGFAALASLNQEMKDEAPKYGAIIADAAAAFDRAPGGANTLTWLPVYLLQGRIEIHPTPEGYRVYGETVIAGSGYRLPVSAAIGKKRIKHGKSDTVKGSTTAGLSVTMTVSGPGSQVRIFVQSAGGTGKFSRKFKVGKRKGKASVKVCVSDANKHSACAAKISFTVV